MSKDYFSQQAEAYTRFRPTYPAELFAFLAEVIPVRQRVWDCATGNGQAALALANWFEEIHASDLSTDQLARANQHPKVHYAHHPAERADLEPSSVDLITVAQAMHWFDFEAFYREVRRVARPHAHLAIWSYDLHTINPKVDEVMYRFYRETLGADWPAQRAHVDRRYDSIPFPFSTLDVPEMVMSKHWCLDQEIGYLSSWSAVQRYKNRTGEDPVAVMAPRLAAAWGDPNQVYEVTFPLVVKIGRIHDSGG